MWDAIGAEFLQGLISVSNEENSHACMDIKASSWLALRMPRGSNTSQPGGILRRNSLDR